MQSCMAARLQEGKELDRRRDNGSLPPSSKMTGVKVLEAASMTFGGRHPLRTIPLDTPMPIAMRAQPPPRQVLNAASVLSA